MEARSVEQTSVFEAAEQFARIEGILPAPESSHAIRAAIDEALKCKETGEEKTIVFGLTGTGYFDMVAYEKFNNGEMSDDIPYRCRFGNRLQGTARYPRKITTALQSQTKALTIKGQSLFYIRNPRIRKAACLRMPLPINNLLFYKSRPCLPYAISATFASISASKASTLSCAACRSSAFTPM